MFPMKKLALASFFLAVLVVVAMNPDISKHHQEGVLQGKQFLQEKAAESGFSGSIIHWGSQHLAEMGIEVQSYTTYALFSTAEIFVAGVHRGESFGCAGKVWILWSEIPKENP